MLGLTWRPGYKGRGMPQDDCRDDPGHMDPEVNLCLQGEGGEIPTVTTLKKVVGVTKVQGS